MQRPSSGWRMNICMKDACAEQEGVSISWPVAAATFSSSFSPGPTLSSYTSSCIHQFSFLYKTVPVDEETLAISALLSAGESRLDARSLESAASCVCPQVLENCHWGGDGSCLPHMIHPAPLNPRTGAFGADLCQQACPFWASILGLFC